MSSTFGDYKGGGSGGGYSSSFSDEKKDWGGKKEWGGNKGGGGGFDRKPKPEELDPTLYLSIAFTGGKDTPQHVIDKMCEMAKYAESRGIVIRVGGDGPVEETVEKAVSKLELILPWKGFNDKTSAFTWSVERAHHIAKAFHDAFESLPKGVKGILAKNARLVMGHKMMSPATALVVWTEDGVETLKDVTSRSGFAGHPIKIAAAAAIRVFNLGKPDAEARFRDFVESLPKQS
jgi:hypothetical protein